jgi:serine/threonine protein phosphatase PrpC
MKLNDYEAPQHSNHPFGIIQAFAGNTYRGLYRNYNEDRVVMSVNCHRSIARSVDYWPSTSFFAIYDGHNGQGCAEFMKNNLHQIIMDDSSFPQDTTNAMIASFQNADAKFFEQAYKKNDASGTCAVVCGILDQNCYVAHVGDSRAVLSLNKGKQTVPLTHDHKPLDPAEYERIKKAGGTVQQLSLGMGTNMMVGPHRVFPGSLTVHPFLLRALILVRFRELLAIWRLRIRELVVTQMLF